MSAELITPLESPHESLLHGLYDVKAQLSKILDSVSHEHYQSTILDHSSIGAHVRHIIEFMQALHVPEDFKTVVNYDDRKRNMEIESTKGTAKNALDAVIKHLGDALQMLGADHPVQMIEKLSTAHESAPISSTLGREIAYVVQHGIHHIFIIKTLAQKHGITLDQDIGVAPATLEYQNKQCAR